MMTVLVTGSATGFGRLTVELLSAEGHTVFATMRAVEGRNAAAARALGGLPRVRVVELDVASDESVERATGQILSEAGYLDCVVNNAGFAGFGLAEEFTLDHWQSVLNTNLLGCVRLNKAVLPGMRARRSGLLIHITSIAGRLAPPYLVPYGCSKWALECFAEGLRLELAPLGVDSVVIEPGKYRTEIFDKADDAPATSPIRQAYGSADLSGKFLEWFMTEMDRNAQDPREVAMAVRNLMAMPFGTRPFRTPVGQDVAWIQPYNDIADQIRVQGAAQMGVSGLLQTSTADAPSAGASAVNE